MNARRYKDFPPGWNHVAVPTSSRRAARNSLGLYTPGGTRGRMVRGAATLATLILGPLALPGKRGPLPVPSPLAAVWADLLGAWRSEIGPFDDVALLRKRQPGRQSAGALLLQRGNPVAFVKLRWDGSTGLRTESEALHLLARQHSTVFSAPAPLALGSIETIDYLAIAPLRSDSRGTATGELPEELFTEVSARLLGLTKPDDTPEAWRPMHGDLAPWNVRKGSSGAYVLIDWEDAAWAPPDADRVYHAITRAALTGATLPAGLSEVALQYWRRRLTERSDDDDGAASNAQLLRIIDAYVGP